MVEPERVHPEGRVLLAVADDGDDWLTLRGHLVSRGWQVELLELSALDQPGGLEAALPPLHGLDAAVVLLAQPPLGAVRGRLALSGPISHMIGLLQGRLGPSRLVVLVEEMMEGIVAGTGITELPYRRGAIDDQFASLRSLVGDALAPPPEPVADTVIEHIRSLLNAVRPASWVYLGGPLVMLALVTVVGLGLLGTGAGASSDLVRVRLDLSILAVERPSSQMPPPATPGAPGELSQLPDRCVLDLSPGVDLNAVVSCERGGRATITGDTGEPWRTRIQAIELDPGVAATITLAPRSGMVAEARVRLDPGGQSLAPYQPELGVERIDVVFVGNGQRVVLRSGTGDGAPSVTIEFRIPA